ncbi:MAG: hypothetical protein R3B09_33930 [Nannocystaceae bacterium]
MAAPPKTPARQPQPAEGEETEPRSRLGWFLGWIMVPGLVLALIVGSGAYVGANHPESWVTRAVLWLAGLFA